MKRILSFALLLTLLFSPLALADLALINSRDLGHGGVEYSTSITTLIAVSLLGLAPFIILVMTPFLRISIVLGLMRNAIGTNTAPSNKVIAAISLLVTFFIMQPHIDTIRDDFYTPYQDGEISEELLLEGSWGVIREFMLNNTKEKSMATILSISNYQDVEDRDSIPASVVIAAYVVSELSVAFFIAFMVFIPFLIIDLLTGVILMSLGMMMVSPMIISLPLKIGFFVIMDGWSLLIINLAKSFSL